MQQNCLHTHARTAAPRSGRVVRQGAPPLRPAAPVGASAGQAATAAPEPPQQQQQQQQQQIPVGVVIVDHGSRAKASNDMLLEFVDLYRVSTGAAIVEAAHMELAQPTIADAIARCAAQGARRVVVAPYFLSRGRHVQQDVPALVAAAAADHPGVDCVVAAPIGVDPLMVRLIANRVQAAAGAPPVQPAAPDAPAGAVGGQQQQQQQQQPQGAVATGAVAGAALAGAAVAWAALANSPPPGM